MKYIITLLTVLLTCCAGCADNPDDARFGYPKGNKRLEIVNHIAYDLGYSEEHEQAAWVSYALTKEDVQTKVTKRTNNFRFDGLVLTGSAALSDYKGSGYDRGHLAPAADMAWSNQAMSESFFLSNMSPQIPSFNRGIWKKLEKYVRSWAVANERLEIITGPVLRDNLPTIGNNNVSVPSYFYKVILDYVGSEKKAIAFIIPNKKVSQGAMGFATTVDNVELETGLDFFSNLGDLEEDALERNVDIRLWPIKSYKSKYVAEEKNYCKDSDTNMQWEAMAQEHPDDLQIQALHALRLGLCFKVDRGDLTVGQATEIFENMRSSLIDAKVREMENQLEGDKKKEKEL